MNRLTPNLIDDPRADLTTDARALHAQQAAPTMAPWVPAVRVGGGPRTMLRGIRVFAGLAALVVLTRRRVARI